MAFGMVGVVGKAAWLSDRGVRDAGREREGERVRGHPKGVSPSPPALQDLGLEMGEGSHFGHAEALRDQ